MNRLVLIGNGFDLAHGLKTSYADFIDWYWEQWGARLLACRKREDSDVFCSFTLKGQEGLSFRSMIERKLASPYAEIPKYVIKQAKEDRSLCRFQMRSPLFEQICKSYETKKWVDIENEYYELLTKCALENYKITTVEELNKHLNYLQEKLIEYLNIVNKTDIQPIASIGGAIYSPFKKQDISIAGQDALIEHIIADLGLPDDEWRKKLYNYCFTGANIDVIKKFREDIGPNTRDFDTEEAPEVLRLPKQIMFLNFNYTNTVEKYNYKWAGYIINQIHGKLDMPESIIFGYGDEMDENYKRLEKKNDNRCLTNIKSIKYLETSSYRKVLSFIESEPYQILIMGHSCGNSDRTLLNTLFEHRNCVSVKPYYYINEKGEDNYLELAQNISRNFKDTQLMRDRVVNKEYCEPLTDCRR